eukprot:SAG22_NODE_15044_length_358_cov_1.285714_1_plen_32_part_10
MVLHARVTPTSPRLVLNESRKSARFLLARYGV